MVVSVFTLVSTSANTVERFSLHLLCVTLCLIHNNYAGYCLLSYYAMFQVLLGTLHESLNRTVNKHCLPILHLGNKGQRN